MKQPLPLIIPEWCKLVAMLGLGYELIPSPHSPNDQGYFKYGNLSGHQANDDYGIMGPHKQEIYFNCGHYTSIGWEKEGIHCSIKEDGGTRTVFHGTLKTQQDLIRVLSWVR